MARYILIGMLAILLFAACAPWLAWGSFWRGIWMRKIDRATGRLDANDATAHPLADRSSGPGNISAIEAPFILFREGKWYLFVSFDRCCQGVDSTYNVRVGRSDALTGPIWIARRASDRRRRHVDPVRVWAMEGTRA